MGDLNNALNEKTQKLQNEKVELNSKYQAQLTQNNDLQQLLNEYRDKIAELEDKIDGGTGSGNGIGNGTGGGNGSGIGNGKGDGNNESINISEEDKKKLDEIKAKEKKEAEIKAKKAKIEKYKGSDDQKIEEKKEENAKPKVIAGQLPPLSAEDEKIVQKFKKQLKVGLPAPLIKKKMKAAKAGHLLAYVFPEEAAKLFEKQKNALPELSEEDKKKLAKYKQMKKVGLPPVVIKKKDEAIQC